MSTLQTIDAIMKLNYGPGSERLQKTLFADFPIFGKIPKKTGKVQATGSALVAPVLYGSPQSMGANFANNITNSRTSAGSNKYTRWTVPFGDYGAVVTFERKMLKLSASDMGCYIDAKKAEIEQVLRQWAATFSWYLLNTKGRSLCSFTIASGVCTVTSSREDIVNIQPGMVLQVSAGSGDAGESLLSANLGYVFAVNQSVNPPTFTVATSQSLADAGTAGTPSGWSGTMFAFRQGDFGGSGATVVCDGFGDWCPASDPSATPFNGVVRTTNVTALSGVRLSSTECAGLNNENRIKRLLTRQSSMGGGAGDWVFVSPEKWQDIADGLESRGLRTAFGKDAQWGYDTLLVTAGGKTVTVFADRFMPASSIYSWQKDAFVLYNAGEFPEVVNDDGLSMLRVADANTYEMRWAAIPATLGTPWLMGRCPAA